MLAEIWRKPRPRSREALTSALPLAAAIALLLALAMQWLPAHATGMALGLAAVLTLLPMALLRRPQLLTLSQPENI